MHKLISDTSHDIWRVFFIMNTATNQTPIRILMFPWLGYGHITPYLELAKKFSSRNFHIHLCSTPATLTSIKQSIGEKFANRIELVPLFLQASPELPPELHTTNGLPPHLMPKLKGAFDDSVESFSLILKNVKPDLLIYDFLQPWAPAAAESHGIPSVIFITSSSTMTSFMFQHFKFFDRPFPFEKIRFHDYESEMRDRLLESARDHEERKRCSVGVERSNGVVLIKGCREIEGKYIDYVSSLVGKKFVPVGPLVGVPDFRGSQDLLSWLDMKGKKSTVFVSFGSEYFLSKEDAVEVALGLELSGVNFIWVVRFLKDENGLLEKTLSEGFLERVGDRGRIVEGWAPQAAILGHGSVGGFVSHCGWNSVLESMYFGVPIIAVPMHLDQPINARLVEEVGVGKEVLRDENKRFCRRAFSEVVKEVVVGDEGEDVRQKAAGMKAKLEDNGDREIDEVVRELVDIYG